MTRENVIHEACYTESEDIVSSILRLIRLKIDQSKGIPVDDEIEVESKRLVGEELRLKRCILKEAKT